MKDKENDFFEKILSDVKKLKNDKKTKESKIKINFQDQSQTKDDSLNPVPKKTNTPIKPAEKKPKTLKNLKIEDGQNFYKKVRRGKIKIDKKLDLHGLRLIEAEKEFDNAILTSYLFNKRCLLVITGKGTRKTNNQNKEKKLYYGKIREKIPEWTRKKTNINKILYFTQAGPEHGGDGSFYVYLRKK